MRVIATAGHVDHGKSTLVRALTGTDPDRWAEEKKRGLTIDLGFAGFDLPSGERIAFVDVPGHRRFIGNMLAGLGPAPVVMFVVAADQGWQAQSREHLDAVDALGLTHGLLVLTRCDLTGPERVATVREEALGHLASTSLGVVPAVETDAVTGRGVDELRSTLDELVDSLPPVVDDAPARLWVDRAFTIKGAGTVVTGTLAAGRLTVGDVLDAGGHRAVVRSLQVLGQDRESVGPVSRVAVGLRGVTRDDVPRGTPVLTPGTSRAATVLDVRRETGRPWSEVSAEVSVRLGTAAVPARVRPLDDDTARLTLESPLPLRLGDRLIIRDDSASRIHCGATVLDIEPAPLTRRGDGAARAETLTEWTAGDVAQLVADRGWVTLDWLRSVRVGADLPTSSELAVGGGYALVQDVIVDARQAVAWRDAARTVLADDARDPLSRGVATAVLADRLGAPEVLVPEIVRLAGLSLREGRVVSSAHGTSLGETDAAIEALRTRLHADPFDAPEADDLAALGLSARQLAAAADRGVILRLHATPADIVLLPDAPARAMRELARLPQLFTTSDARQALGTTRRVVIPLLEHLDARGWTRREGNARRIVR